MRNINCYDLRIMYIHEYASGALKDLLMYLRGEIIRMIKYLEYPIATEEDNDCTVKSNVDDFYGKLNILSTIPKTK